MVFTDENATVNRVVAATGSGVGTIEKNKFMPADRDWAKWDGGSEAAVWITKPNHEKYEYAQYRDPGLFIGPGAMETLITRQTTSRNLRARD
jgi:hypothetical protein